MKCRYIRAKVRYLLIQLIAGPQSQPGRICSRLAYKDAFKVLGAANRQGCRCHRCAGTYPRKGVPQAMVAYP